MYTHLLRYTRIVLINCWIYKYQVINTLVNVYGIPRNTATMIANIAYSNQTLVQE